MFKTIRKWAKTLFRASVIEPSDAFKYMCRYYTVVDTKLEGLVTYYNDITTDTEVSSSWLLHLPLFNDCLGKFENIKEYPSKCLHLFDLGDRWGYAALTPNLHVGIFKDGDEWLIRSSLSAAHGGFDHIYTHNGILDEHAFRVLLTVRDDCAKGRVITHWTSEDNKDSTSTLGYYCNGRICDEIDFFDDSIYIDLVTKIMDVMWLPRFTNPKDFDGTAYITDWSNHVVIAKASELFRAGLNDEIHSALFQHNLSVLKSTMLSTLGNDALTHLAYVPEVGVMPITTAFTYKKTGSFDLLQVDSIRGFIPHGEIGTFILLNDELLEPIIAELHT